MIKNASKIRAGIINVSGYAGAELARLLYQHAQVDLISVTARSASGQKIGQLFPHLADIDLVITPDIVGELDVVFSALPHSASAERVEKMLDQDVNVIDLSADFRLKDINEYQSWYATEHPCPKYIDQAVYGLPELHRNEISSSKLIAVPGCYPTAAILSLMPAVSSGVIEPDIIIDAKSGVSGSGRSLSLMSHYSEVNDNLMAYSVDGHRHMPEITQELNKADYFDKPKITLLTHLVPMTRGILVSCYAPLKSNMSLNNGVSITDYVMDVYKDFYRDEPFVKIVNTSPMTKHTVGSNNCVIYPTIDVRTNRLIVISCIDNLIKGAAGQAVQNMNIMFDISETKGLESLPCYP